jgi:hypothetical protein
MASALERAARALCIEQGHHPDWFDVEDTTETPIWMEYVSSARAVLMAVIPTLKRYDSDQAGQYEDERGDYVLFDDLDAILNEKDATNLSEDW